MFSKRSSLSLLVAGVLSLGFVGCNSSSGGSDDSSTAFPSDASAAKPTKENAKKVKEAVVNTNPTSTLSALEGLDQVSTPTGLNVALLGAETTKSIMETAKNANLQTYALNEAFDQTVDCEGGGKLHIYGNLNEKEEGTINLAYDHCKWDTLMINGTVQATLSNYNETYEDYKNYGVKFITDYTVTAGSTTITIYKNSYEKAEMLRFDDPEQFRLDLSIIASDGSQKFGVKDAQYVVTEPDDETDIYQTKGRIYINNLASYVDYDTSYNMSATPFVYSELHGLQSGEARYIMSGGTKLRIVVESGTPVAYIDTDGDGTYETKVTE